MERAVLVTGASSGIGRRLTERLSSLGHRVYATARKERDLRSLAALDHVIPIPLDVRAAAQIDRAAEQVAAGGLGLWGLVNNAGIGGIGPIASWSDPELESIFAVNALGPVRMSRSFLPLLLESRGRIVNVSSQGGSISKKYFGPYTMTKHALEAFTVALDEEVAPFGVRVCVVQPGGVATSIGEKSIEEDLGRFRRAPAPFDVEARAIAAALEGAASSNGAAAGSEHSSGEAREPDSRPAGASEESDEPESETNRKPSPPDLVANAILHALFDPQPRRRYLVGTRWEGDRVIHALLEQLLDANACPALGYSRDELVAWLDRKMAGM